MPSRSCARQAKTRGPNQPRARSCCAFSFTLTATSSSCCCPATTRARVPARPIRTLRSSRRAGISNAGRNEKKYASGSRFRCGIARLDVWRIRHILFLGAYAMATKFADFMRALEEEARAEGPEAVEQLAALRDHFRLGRQLADARMKRKLTQQQVAKLSRIDQADVSNIERGVANPTLGTLSAVAMAVGMEIDLRKRR